jgi:acyl-CoA reductase-like NAD-dependent aldehyde dehydrogenase
MARKLLASETKDVINPATEEPFAAAPIATPQHLEDAVNAASRAFPSWSATPVEETTGDALEPWRPCRKASAAIRRTP